MVEIATVLAAETLLEKMVSLAYRFYGWMYPAVNNMNDMNHTISTEEEKEMVIVVKRIMEERKK